MLHHALVHTSRWIGRFALAFHSDLLAKTIVQNHLNHGTVQNLPARKL